MSYTNHFTGDKSSGSIKLSNYTLIFDDLILNQLQRAAKNQQIKTLIKKMLDKLELLGPLAGKLLDSHLFVYEMKNKHPPLRLYYKHNLVTNEIYVFEYETKTNEEKQEQTISKIIFKARNLKS